MEANSRTWLAVKTLNLLLQSCLHPVRFVFHDAIFEDLAGSAVHVNNRGII